MELPELHSHCSSIVPPLLVKSHLPRCEAALRSHVHGSIANDANGFDHRKSQYLGILFRFLGMVNLDLYNQTHGLKNLELSCQSQEHS